MSNVIKILADDINANPLGWSQAVIDDDDQLLNYYNNVGNVAPRTFNRKVVRGDLSLWAAAGHNSGAAIDASKTRWERLKAGTSFATGTDTVNSRVRTYCEIILEWIKQSEPLDVDNAAHVTMFTFIRDEGVLVNGDLTDLLTEASVSGTRAEEIGAVALGEELFVGNIRIAREYLASQV